MSLEDVKKLQKNKIEEVKTKNPLPFVQVSGFLLFIQRKNFVSKLIVTGIIASFAKYMANQ